MEGSNVQWVPSSCYMCFNCCGIKVKLVDGQVVDIVGHPENPNTLGRLCAKGKAAILGLYNPYRVKTPLKRTNPRKGLTEDPGWQEISWDEALETVAGRLKEVREKDPRQLFIAQCDFPVVPQANAFASAFGTPNNGWTGAGYFCGNGVHPIMYLMHGAFYSRVDLDLCRYLVMFGSQAGFMTHIGAVEEAGKMAEARRRGLKLIVVDPVGGHAAAKANEWIPIRPGTDAALALCLVNLLVNELGFYDAPFLRCQTNAPYLIGLEGLYVRDPASGKPLVFDLKKREARTYDEGDSSDLALEGEYQANGSLARPAFQLLKEHVKSYTPEAVSRLTTVPQEIILRLAQEFGQAANLGGTITLEGHELPYRPAVADYSRGAIAHKHGFQAGMAIELINLVVGAVGVPGGQIPVNTSGSGGRPRKGPDGLLIPGEEASFYFSPYPARKVKQPESLELIELFPIAIYARPVAEVTLKEPDKFNLPYRPRVILHVRSNQMMSCGQPASMAKVLTGTPFMVSFACELNETVQLADIVLPDTFFLERLEPFAVDPRTGRRDSADSWPTSLRQPVVAPAGQARTWLEVLFDLSQRIGITDDMNLAFNSILRLKEPYKLQRGDSYSREEVIDRWAKSWFGPEHDLAWFKSHGFLNQRKKVQDKYPRLFLEARIPVYLEYLISVRQELDRVTKEINLAWDTSDYQPLPSWKPCPAFQDTAAQDELYAVNYKLPFHTFSYTTENPWLTELAEHHSYAFRVLVPAAYAKRKGIRDGDELVIQSQAGQVKGLAKVSQCIHPEVVGIAGTFGHWSKEMPVSLGKGVHFNSLLPTELERIDMLGAGLDACVRVKVYKE
ncbi:MAG: molybdopterin-dependent oxidoreductase [Thermodesulfobacteriota bacterium]